MNWYSTLVLKLCYLWTLHRKEWQLHSIVATWLTRIKTIRLLLQLRNLLPNHFHMGLAAYCDSLAFSHYSLQNAIVRIWLEKLNKRMRSFSFQLSHQVVIRILKILSILKFQKGEPWSGSENVQQRQKDLARECWASRSDIATRFKETSKEANWTPRTHARSEYRNAELKRKTADKNEKEDQTYALIVDDEDKAREVVKTPPPLPVPEDDPWRSSALHNPVPLLAIARLEEVAITKILSINHTQISCGRWQNSAC